MIYTFTGSNKGKTSAALGTVMRALGKGEKTRIVFFMKHWQTSEGHFLDKLKEKGFDIDYFLAGDNDFVYDRGVNDIGQEEAQQELKFGNVQKKDKLDVKLAKKGIDRARKYLEEAPFLLVLDELNMALEFGLVTEEAVQDLINKSKEANTHLVITGRTLPKFIEEESNLITDMKKIKHPFDDKQYAIKGLDY